MLRELRASVVDWVRVLPRGVRWTLAAAVVGIVVLALLRSGGHRPVALRHGPTPSTAPAAAVAMLRRDGQAVVGVLETRDGAAAAAISYVQQRNALLTGGTTAETAAEVGGRLAVAGRDIGADPASIPDRAGAVNTRAMLETRAGQMTWWTIPFAYRVRAYGTGRALVRVFFGLLNASALPGDGPAVITTNLQDVSLVWRHGAWRLIEVRQAPDQPTVAAAVGVSTRRDMESKPIPQRLIETRERTGVPLFSFLNEATPVLVGPAEMGPVAASATVGPDRATIVRALADASRAGVRSDGMAGGGRLSSRGLSWSSSVPVAYRPTVCPREASGRCYLVLTAGATTAGGPALIALTVSGVVLSNSGSSMTIAPFGVPAATERNVLGGLVTVAGVGTDSRYMYGAAWIRSIRPLLPTIVAAPR